MRQRSTRLFILLLHVLGLSSNLPNSQQGLLGVNPEHIVLEELDLQKFENGLDGLLQHAAKWRRNGDAILLSEPYWFKDEVDGKCLGLAGFSECGDSTLWRVRRRRPSTQTRKRRRGLRWSGRRQRTEREYGYAIQLVEDLSPSSSSLSLSSPTTNPMNNITALEHNLTKTASCLVRTRRKERSGGVGASMIGVGSCTNLPDKHIWTWNIDRDGVLSRREASKLRQEKQSGRMNEKETNSTDKTRKTLCVRRNGVNETNAVVLATCDTEEEHDDYLVQFSIVRFMPTPLEPVEEEGETHDDGYRQSEAPPLDHIGASTDLAHQLASSVNTPQVRPANHHPIHRIGAKKKEEKENPKRTLLSLQDTNPILFLDTKEETSASANKRDDKSSVIVGTQQHQQNHHIIETPSKLVRMQTHPYLATAKDGIWTDPKTGLLYPTDLSEYLGHDRKESGRHTLVGVGQYTKTFLTYPAKVYGIALYMSKRDVLADPTFEKYATKTDQELREIPEFYSHLRSVPGYLPNQGLVDRTLLLKLNMQLSTNTMRSSLATDWKLLTQELKDLLINSSLKPRPAHEDMLKTITSDTNPGRCSCGQVAPPEYKADVSCCARGTELVFTWRKNGHLEVRLDGRMMDIFPRPDAAQGIFFEYLRYDDPISPDFRERLVDGFPFLLAPLAQVKGVTALPLAHISQKQGQQQQRQDSRQDIQALLSAVGGLADRVSTVGDSVGEFVQHHANEAVSNFVGAARSVGDTMRNVGQGIDRKREQLWGHVHEHSSNFLSNRVPPLRDGVSSAWKHVVRRHRRKMRHNPTSDESTSSSSPRGKVFHSTGTQWFGQGNDPNDPAQSTAYLTRQVMLCLVHMYLMLLLIVSFPGPHEVVYRKRRMKKLSGSDTESEASSDSSFEVEEEHRNGVDLVGHDLYDSMRNGGGAGSEEREGVGSNAAAAFGAGREMTKSLSYCL